MGVLPQEARRAGGDLAAEDRRQELPRAGAVEGGDLLVGDEVLLPQRVDGVRCLGAGPHRGDEADASGRHQAEQRHGRRVVEQVGVVDDDEARLRLVRQLELPAHGVDDERRVRPGWRRRAGAGRARRT